MPEEKGSYLRRTPEAQPLVEAGIRPNQAVKLARAGFTSLEKIAAATRDDLLAIYGVSLVTVETCEKLIGHPLPWPTAYWRERGFNRPVAKILCDAGIDSLEAVGKHTAKELRGLGIPWFFIQRLEELSGRSLPQPE